MGALELVNISDTVPDVPVSGPLKLYRSQASFDWKQLKLLLEGEQELLLKNKIWNMMENDPVFCHPQKPVSVDEYRLLTLRRVLRIAELNFLKDEDLIKNPRLAAAYIVALGQYDWSVGLKQALMFTYNRTNLLMQGTDRHRDLLDAALNLQISGCLCLTEFGHGTNTRGFLTTATYDHETQEFVINSPSFEAGKCWVGNLGKTATHATLLAQLITEDGVSHGLHSFIVPIRSMTSLVPFPGVIIGDMGEKIGLNGLDNGFIIFNNFRIPRENLLNQNGDVTPDGKYISAHKDQSKKFGESLGGLSVGRVAITTMGSANICKALPIAIRYSAVRKQFGPPGKPEQALLEYQLQQWRLFPHLAGAYVLKYFSDEFYVYFMKQQMEMVFSGRGAVSQATKAEMHAISCVSKCLSGWLARDAIQECREACGGHGYLAASGLGILRNDNDSNLTYEGDNNVLLQQTSNWLLRLAGSKIRGESNIDYGSLGTASFIENFDTIVSTVLDVRKPSDVLNITAILESYQWLICWLLRNTMNKLRHLEADLKQDSFTARNNTQVYSAHPLAVAYGEYIFISWFWSFCERIHHMPQIRSVLNKLCLLFGLFRIEKHLPILYQGGYISGSNPPTFIKDGILDLCELLKPEAVALADVLAPPDFIMNSPLGKSDGEVYKHLESLLMHTTGVTDRAEWWPEVSHWLKSRL